MTWRENPTGAELLNETGDVIAVIVPGRFGWNGAKCSVYLVEPGEKSRVGGIKMMDRFDTLASAKAAAEHATGARSVGAAS